MASNRELFFVCTVSNRSRTISRPVRAWDEREAALLFMEILKEEGCWIRGRVEVHPLVSSPTPSTSLHAVMPG